MSATPTSKHTERGTASATIETQFQLKVQSRIAFAFLALAWKARRFRINDATTGYADSTALPQVLGDLFALREFSFSKDGLKAFKPGKEFIVAHMGGGSLNQTGLNLLQVPLPVADR
jgi:hypothetical protein